MRTFFCCLTFLFASGAANALSSTDTGVFVAVDEEGQPIEKILRVSQKESGWKFEDRQPDGSWLDVSCHGGCEHRASSVDDLVEFFGAAPPPGLTPECVQNQQYAFCHFVKHTPDEQREGYVLVVRVEQGWLPVSMVRLPDGSDGSDGESEPAPKARLEAAALF